MGDRSLYDTLVEALPVIAKITGGYAAITDRKGVRLKTVDFSGEELTHLRGLIFTLGKKAGESDKAISGMSQLEFGAESWALPIGDYVICSSNTERMKRNNDLKEALIVSLPFIARVAGGEAVVFDEDGKRIATVDSKGNVNKKYLHMVSEKAREAMTTQKPVIGQSSTVSGAIAARIPITKDFGFGFNNEEASLKNQKLINEVKKYQYAKYNFSDIIGESPQMKKVKEIAYTAAESSSNILIYGETGTGKELFAQSIHNASSRRNNPFVAINCAALPPSLIESNLFGYENGAFTGAKKGGASGVFEQASGGTLFLDEITEMELELQVKLLRVLQEREITRIGGSKTIPLDIRIIAATNKPIDEMAKEGKFRKDLFFRLNVIDIKTVPLRYMKEDIALIVSENINKMNILFGKFIKGIEREAIEELVKYDWPGNVRELINCLEKVFNVIGSDSFIKKEHLSFKFFNDVEDNNIDDSLSDMLSTYERNIILKALKEANNVKVDAAKRLKISTTTLWRRMKDLEIQ